MQVSVAALLPHSLPPLLTTFNLWDLELGKW